MEQYLLRLKEIKEQTDKKSDIKIINYLELIEHAIKKGNLFELIKIKNNITLERKTLKNIYHLNSNFPLFIKYDNIYREMENLIRFILQKEKKYEK
ncbi:MAG: hypothetical protein N2Z20_00500 [Elusimicrobiales bacterium]|nr:hypothetical protein [Elusimicrobiales bacterium]